jgi:hypothetical protein
MSLTNTKIRNVKSGKKPLSCSMNVDYTWVLGLPTLNKCN